MVRDVLREILYVLPHPSQIQHIYIHDRPSLHNSAGATDHGQLTNSQVRTCQPSFCRFPARSPDLACEDLMQNKYCRRALEHSNREREQEPE
jgi:hypothetical protein